MITDETIYQQYLRGETNAADLLVEKYADMLIFYINGYIKDVHEAEDLMIEAFSQIFAKERPITGDKWGLWMMRFIIHLSKWKEDHRGLMRILCLGYISGERSHAN